MREGEGRVAMIYVTLSVPDLSLQDSRRSAGSFPKQPLVIKSIGREGESGVSHYHVILVSQMREESKNIPRCSTTNFIKQLSATFTISYIINTLTVKQSTYTL